VIPPNFEYHICEFPSWQAYADAMRLVGGAGLAFGLQKTGGPGSVGNCVTGNNNEFYEMRSKGELELPWKSFCIVMAGATMEEHDWQVKTLNKILEETGGKIAEVGEEPMWKHRDFLTMIKACFIPRLSFRPAGTFGVDGMIGMDTTDQMALGLGDDEAHFQKWRKTGILFDCGDLNNWSVAYEGSHFALFECGWQFSSIDERSWKPYQQMTAEGFEICYKKPYSISWSIMGAEELKKIGPVCMNYNNWMYKIKNTLDPNIVSDPSLYPTGKK
jgi:hypothetical protein